MAEELKRSGGRLPSRRDLYWPVVLSALVLPGAGQIYNRDFKRGFVLLGLTILYMMTFAIGVGTEAVRNLPRDMTTWDPEMMRQFSEHLWQSQPAFMRTFNWLMTFTWVYSIFDAYWGARERIRQRLGLPGEPPS